MATLLVNGCAPPAPSIWRESLPIAATSTRSRTASSAGKSSLRKYSPFELPPRIKKQGMAVGMPRMVRRALGTLLHSRSEAPRLAPHRLLDGGETRKPEWSAGNRATNEATGRTKASGTRVLAALDRHAPRARRVDRSRVRSAGAGERHRSRAAAAELLRHRRRGRQHPHADGTRRRHPRRLRLHGDGRRGAGRDSPADASADSLHHQHEHGRRPRRRQRGALEGGLEHPAGRRCGRRRVGRRRPREFRLRERARARERAHADVCGGAADPVGVFGRRKRSSTACIRCT